MSAAEKLRALAGSGTPGPWWTEGSWRLHGQEHPIVGHGHTGAALVAYTARRDRTDAHKIVAAVNMLPAVAALVEALQHQHSAYGGVEETCTDCGCEYPCATARALADLTDALGGES